MSSTIAVKLILAILNLAHSLSIQKVVEPLDEPMMAAKSDSDDGTTKPREKSKPYRLGIKLGTFCVFGQCIEDKHDYEESINVHKNRQQVEEELTTKQDELEQWKKDEEERATLEAEEARAKMQDERDSTIAASCQCTWECGDRNDGTVCFRKCCNGEFGGRSILPSITNSILNAAGAGLQAATATTPPKEEKASETAKPKTAVDLERERLGLTPNSAWGTGFGAFGANPYMAGNPYAAANPFLAGNPYMTGNIASRPFAKKEKQPPVVSMRMAR